MSLKLVLHHAYERGNAFDLSGHGLHGRLTDVSPGSPGTLSFDGGASRVDVTPTADLARMRELHVRGRFQVDSSAAHTVKRHNLVEGFASFALYVDTGFGVRATIVDATGAWNGVATAPRVVVPGQWHQADLFHDGISRMRLYLDGALSAERFDVPGPIRDIGALGLAIGHWPDPGDAYTLYGELDDVKIWRDDLEDEARDRVDPCCVDRGGLDELVRGARADGWDATSLGALVQDVLGLGTEIATAARGGDEARSRELSGLVRDATQALGARDPDGLADGLGRIEGFLTANVATAELEAYRERGLDQLGALPVAELLFGTENRPGLQVDAIRHVASLLCLDVLLPPSPPADRPDDDGQPVGPDGDPDTDAPSGKEPAGWSIGGEDTGKDDPPVDDPDKPPTPRPEAMWEPFDHDQQAGTQPTEPPEEDDG